MNSDRRKTPQQGPAAAHRPAGRTPLAQANRPRAVQPKMPAAPPSARQTGRTPSAPPVYRPQPTPKVLQPKSASAAPRRPVAPPVYRPEAKKLVQPKMAALTRQTPKAPPVYRPEPKKIVQPKMGVAMRTRTIQAAHPASCAHPAHKHPSPQIRPETRQPPARGSINAAQPKQARTPPAVQLKSGPTTTATPKEVSVGARNSRPTPLKTSHPSTVLRPRMLPAPPGGTIQMDAAYHTWMKDREKLLEKLEEDHYLFQDYATTVAATVTNKHGNQRRIKALDVSDKNDTHPELKGLLMGLMSSVHIRPATPEHDNQEQNLPTGTKYYEMGMEGGGGTRIVIAADTGDVYFSQHYGGRQNVTATGAPKPDSPFLKITGMTAAEKSVPKYKIIFFRHEVEAYNKSAKKKDASGYDGMDVDEKVKGLENALDVKAEEARVLFKGLHQDAIDGVLKEMWDIYNTRVSKNPHASIEYMISCLIEVRKLIANRAL